MMAFLAIFIDCALAHRFIGTGYNFEYLWTLAVADMAYVICSSSWTSFVSRRVGGDATGGVVVLEE